MNGSLGKCRGALTVAEIRRLNLSLNLSRPKQRDAWKIIRTIPAGQRTDAVCRMICQAGKQKNLLDSIRSVFREELSRVEFVSEKGKPEPPVGDVDDDVLGFLRSLQEGDD